MEDAVWVEPGSTATTLTFGIGAKRGQPGGTFVGGFRVEACSDDRIAHPGLLMWGAGRGAKVTPEQSRLSRIRYGEVPPGYERLTGQADTALTLVPGCYLAQASGTGQAIFDVLLDGRVVERPADR